MASVGILSLLILVILQDANTQFGPIPQHLLECYNNDDVTLLPMTVNTLIDILRKIELNHEYIMDMRILAHSIMKRFWRDGIERDPNILPLPGVIPYSTTGFQSYKYSLVYSHLLPGTESTFPNETLTIHERCTLHFMVSGSVDPWERGNENDVCPSAYLTQKNIISKEQTGVKRSACPIEKGVVQINEEYGTINAGHVMLGVAMALEPMQVAQLTLLRNMNVTSLARYDKVVDNLYAATISGDLAEILVFQIPLTNNVTLGPSGQWNNTYLPAEYYMIADQNCIDRGCWQSTDAEMFGSIDGLILAEEAVRWSNLMFPLKLSQLLEMFYTNKGGYFPGQFHVCKRRKYFFDNLQSKQEIKQQTEYFADILALTSPHSFVNDEEYIRRNIERVNKAFMDYMTTLLGKDTSCPETSATSKLQLYVLYDSTWSQYYTLQFLMRLSSIIDLTYYGSNITVINGANGAKIVDSATTEGDLFFQWQNFTTTLKEVKSTGLKRGFSSLENTLASKDTPKNPTGLITLVIGLSSSISDLEYSYIKSKITSIKTMNPDMTFLYLTTQANGGSFSKFTSIRRAQYDRIVRLNTKEQDRLVNDLEKLNKVPRTIIPTACNGSRIFTNLTYEEYITPNLIYIYRIHPAYLCSSNQTVSIKIKNQNYGNIDTCIARSSFLKPSNNATCRFVSLFEETEYIIDNPCNNNQGTQNFEDSCKPIYLKVVSSKSTRKCTEKDCRFPDQIRFNIEVNGLKCIADNNVTCDANKISATFFFAILFTIYSFLIK